jgi:nicotinate-nucleotide pyrophosphorylase (carboxylating)
MNTQAMRFVLFSMRLYIPKLIVAFVPCRILDTRKTAPGLRLLDKWAVALGGGTPHRMGLYDMMMIKDNHIAAAGGIR